MVSENCVDLMEFKLLNTKNNPPVSFSYATQMIGAALEWDEVLGKGSKIAVLDTGVDHNHPDLKHLAGSVDFTGEGVQDDNGHGTWCVGAIGAKGKMQGVAPDAEFWSLKVVGKNGGSSWVNVLNALDWCLANNVDIVSMSIGGGMSLAMQETFEKKIDELYAAGVKLIAAAGNMGGCFPDEDTVLFPAHFNSVVAVVSVNIETKRSQFSSMGAQAEIACAGETVWGLWPGGLYAQLSGTSMACPAFAGAVALMDGKAVKRRGYAMTPAEMRLVAMQRADDRYLPGRDRKYGYGIFSFDRLDRVFKNTIIEMQIDNPIAYINGREQQIDPTNPRVVPLILENRTMLPARFVAESLGASVGWQENERKITIKK